MNRHHFSYDDTDGALAAQEYLEHGGDPDSYPDQQTIRRILPWFLLHREPGHCCEVCSSGDPIPTGPHVTFRRKARALSHLLDGGDALSFEDQEAITSVRSIYERSFPKLPLFEEKERA